MTRESEQQHNGSEMKENESRESIAKKITNAAENINSFIKKPLEKSDSVLEVQQYESVFDNLLEEATKKGFLSELSENDINVFKINREGLFTLNKKIKNKDGDVGKLEEQRKKLFQIMQRVIVRYNPQTEEIRYFRVKLENEKYGGVFDESKKKFEPVDGLSEEVYDSLKKAELRCRKEKNEIKKEFREIIEHNKNSWTILKDLLIEDAKLDKEEIEIDIEEFKKTLELLYKILSR